jgi:hypothetical protein
VIQNVRVQAKTAQRIGDRFRIRFTRGREKDKAYTDEDFDLLWYDSLFASCMRIARTTACVVCVCVCSALGETEGGEWYCLLVPMSVLVEHKHASSVTHNVQEADVNPNIRFAVDRASDWTTPFVFKLDDKTFGDSVKQVLTSLLSTV